VIARGDGWWAIDKPPGLPSHRTDEGGVAAPERLAELTGVAAQPVHRLDRETSGVLVLAVGDAVGALSSRFEAREVSKTYVAIVRPAPEADATLADEDADMHASLRVLRRSADATRAEVEVRPREGRTHQVRRLLAGAGTPILGDLEYGRPPPGGAPRMALHCLALSWDDVAIEAHRPVGWDGLLDPVAEPARAPSRPPREPRERRTSKRSTLRVSRATARILRSGHPWVVRDRDTGRLDRLEPGELVELEDPAGRWVATAVADPKREVCARVVSSRPDSKLDEEAWRRRAERAVSRRSALLTDERTDAFRLIHGEADGLPGLFVDRWGPVLVATRTTEATATFAAPVYAAVSERLPGLPLYEKDHLTDLRSRTDAASGDDLAGRWIRGGHDGDVHVREAGLELVASPFGGLTTGFYPDQRANRALLAGLPDLPGAEVANLFAHTGAFSVAVAAAGAGRVHSVDLSRRYLDLAAANLRRNGLGPERHPLVAEDAVRWLVAGDAPLDGVILDPPVFAQGRGRGRGFSARGDYRALVAAAARRLRPGGWLLCCRNLRSERKGKLRTEVEAGIRDAGGRPAEVRRAGPSPDFPVLKGFPEGTSFHGVFARVSS